MGIKSAVKDWMSEKWEQWVKRPIGDKTKQLEDSATQQFNTYAGKAQEQIKKPGDYYWKQEPFYRGLFWIGVGCLIVLWIISGS